MADRVERSGVFCWNRKPLKVKVLSTVLFYSVLSCRVVARVLRGSTRFAHESVRLWFRRMKDAFPKPKQTRRRVIAVEETKLKLCGEQFYVWAAVDAKTKEVSACRVSWVRNMLHAEAILRKILETCTNKPLILIDKGPWYPDALRSLGLKWKHVTFGMCNRIERWFGILKARTKRFSNNFPNNSTLKSAKTFLEAFIALYNTLLKTKT
ncbi:MAG: DDE-type integrase/transposase/recombinase [Candidatus Bathyarchaeia archaeon]